VVWLSCNLHSQQAVNGEVYQGRWLLTTCLLTLVKRPRHDGRLCAF
jgi:hypothetical protein